MLADINEALRLYILSNFLDTSCCALGYIYVLFKILKLQYVLLGSLMTLVLDLLLATTPSLHLQQILVDRSTELPAPHDIGGNLRASKVIRVGGPDRSSIILPLSGLKQFHGMVAYFFEISKDGIEGMAVQIYGRWVLLKDYLLFAR
ncbi:Transcription factor Pur-alpha 1, partial [Bienertia sinuspersici]